MNIENIYLSKQSNQPFNKQIQIYIKKNIHPFFWGVVSKYPCYNSETIATYPCLLCRIKDAPINLLGVYFDDGVRPASFKGEIKYSLTDLKKMSNGAKKMYLFWQKTLNQTNKKTRF